MQNNVRSLSRPVLKTALPLAAAVLAWTPAHAQTVRGLHDVPSVTVVQPQPAQAATPAAPAPTPVAPLTVQEPLRPEVVREAARTFVEVHAAPTAKINQVARWHNAICVEASGLPAEEAAKVVSRIESVAKSIGVHVMKPGCNANIEIEFTNQPQHLVDTIAARTEPILGYHYPSDLERVKRVTHPIQAWYATATSGGAGGGAGTAFGGGGGDGAGNYGAVGGVGQQMEGLDGPESLIPAGCGDNPRITACLRSKFVNVLIVADNGAISGKELGLVADYMAMLALSQPKSLDACNPLPSIMDLFAKDCAGRAPPDDLTPADASYLTALYASDPEDKLASAESDIAGRMTRILIKASGKSR